MNKHINRSLIYMLVALIVVSAGLLVMHATRDSLAVEQAKEAYQLYISENPASKESDFIYIYDEHIIIAIRDGKVMKKEYVSEAQAVKAATGNSKVLHYSLSSTGNDKLFTVKIFDKNSDVYAVGSQALAVGANALTIKVVSNGTIFANFEIPAAAIADKNSPVAVTISKIDPEDNVKLGANQEGFAYDIDVTNLVENNTSLIKVSMNGPKGLSAKDKDSAIQVYHKTTPINSTYDTKTGEVSFNTTDFSPYTFTYDMITVNTVEELRYYLQREGNGNIRLGQDITIDLATYRDTTDDTTGKDVAYTDDNGYKVFYARGFYDGQWVYFGSLIIGDKAIDLNGKSITYTGSKSKKDLALFAVASNSALTIIDSSRTEEKEGTGEIIVPYDQYAVWAVNPSSTANIYGGIFMTDEYVTAGQTAPDAALLYSSGGKINVFGGYYMYSGNGAFNVTNEINDPTIRIYEGVHLSNKLFRDNQDTDSILLMGGATLPDTAATSREWMGTSEVKITNWYTVNGRQLEVDPTLNNYKYLYRVGNGNTFTLGAFFDELVSGLSGNVGVRVVDIVATNKHNAGTTLNKNDKNSGYYEYIGDQTTTYYTFTANNTDWTKSTVQFANTFTGPVRLELCSKDLSVVYASINLEVVPGKNVTVASEITGSTNFVLLNDIELTSSVTGFSIGSKKTLFGNGFTINFAGFGNKTAKNDGVIKLSGGTLDNVRIIGDKYSTYVDTYDTAGYAAAVYATGESYIYNSYISGCQMPIRMNASSLALENTTLEGGRYCNLLLRGGELTLNNVTTIQKKEVIDGKTCLGLGIFVDEVAPLGTKIKIIGNLTQYNWVARADTDYLPGKAADYVGVAYSYDQFVYNTDYVNSGIISISTEVLKDSIELPAGYSGQNVGTAACVVTCDKTLNSTYLNNGIPEYAGWNPSRQGAIKPTFTEASRKEYTNGAFVISFNDGLTYNFDPNFLKATKFGKELAVHVTLSGGDNSGDYTGKEITFDKAGKYTLIYTLTDPYNYYGADAVAINIPYEFTYSLEVSVITDNTKHADFTFNGAAANVEEINGKWYAWPSSGVEVTVGNKTIYAPTVNVQYSDNYTSRDFYCYSPIFTAVNITDYAGGVKTGTATTYSKSTTTMLDSSKFNYSTNNSKTTKPYLNGATSDDGVFTYSSYGLCYRAKKGSNISASTQLVEYWYKDNAGRTYYYYIQYSFAKHNAPCVTPDTLVTLADGTKKEIQHVTYTDMLLVWNFYTGEYDVMPASIVMNHGYDNYTVLTLNFADGTSVKTINGHGFFDAGDRKYVILNTGNVADYVGHEFAKVDGDGYATTELVSYSIKTEYTESWSILTAEQYNCILEDMWTITPAEVEGSPDYLMPFEVGADMKYDEAKMQVDIEKYGLYTYEDFAEYMTEEQFTALGLSTWKVAVGKGYITWNDILYLIEIHLG